MTLDHAPGGSRRRSARTLLAFLSLALAPVIGGGLVVLRASEEGWSTASLAAPHPSPETTEGGTGRLEVRTAALVAAPAPLRAARDRDRQAFSHDLEAEVPALPQVLLVSAYHAERLSLAAPAVPLRAQVALEVKPGDTLMEMLVGAGFARSEAYEAITALREVFSPRELKPGQLLEVAYETLAPDPGADTPEAQRLISIALSPSVERDVKVERGPEQLFVASAFDKPLVKTDAGARGEIHSSLFEAALEAEVPQGVLLEAIRAFSYDVDFQRDIQPGDGFRLLFETYADEGGVRVKTGALLFAELTLSGKAIPLYRFTTKKGNSDYFNEKGESVRRQLLRTPIDGARISSGFGMRRHPILGYTRMHQGLDFAAPSGTPIYAAGDGVVELAGWHGGYGKYVRVRHNSTYKTAYAHMSRIAKGVANGTRVQQGQVIGYVGTTGRSTGPHLHYEVFMGSKQVNPASVKMPSGEKLAGAELEAFQAVRREIDRRLLRSLPRTQVASAPGCEAPRGAEIPGC